MTCTQHRDDQDSLIIEKIPFLKRLWIIFLGGVVAIVAQMMVKGHLSYDKLKLSDNKEGLLVGSIPLLFVCLVMSYFAAHAKETSIGKYALTGIGGMAVIGGVGLEFILAQLFK